MDTQYQLEAHERECAVRYEYVQNKLEGLEKRMWRLEGLIMVSTITVIGAAVAVITPVTLTPSEVTFNLSVVSFVCKVN